MLDSVLIQDPIGQITVLLLIPAILIYLESHKATAGFFRIIPVLVFAYFVPTVLASFHIIPASSTVYLEIKNTVLPASLYLITLSVDLKSIMKLGSKAVILFLSGTLGIFIGGPISLLIFRDYLPPDAWKGMAALAGSWIGGGANFIAVGNAVGASETMMGMMVIVDVGVASVWTGLLMYMAGRYKQIDQRLGADNSAIENLKNEITKFQTETARIATTKDYMILFAVTATCVWISNQLGNFLPEIGDIISHSTWKIIIITTLGLLTSFTQLKHLEGVGASKFGSMFLYMLIGVIGASANLSEMIKHPALIGMGVVWISIHALVITLTMRLTKAPLFFMAVGSQANIGAAASAPIVASAFHPSLATVGVLLAVLGYVLGTYVALLCAGLLKFVAGV